MTGLATTGAGERRPPTRLAALLLDAYEAVLVAAHQLPGPGQGGAIGRLSPGGWVIGHLAVQQDRSWNVGAQGLDADPWLAEHGEAFRTGAEPLTPVFAEALAAFERVTARARPYLESLDAVAVEAAIDGGPDEALGVRLARHAAHLFVHAGELAALASLVGQPDTPLPGPLTHSRRARG